MASDLARKTKETLFVPLIFAGLFLASAVLFSAGITLVVWTASYSPGIRFTPAWVFAVEPAILGRVLLISTVSSTFFILFRVLKHPGFRPLSVLLALASAAAVLYFGTLGWHRYFPDPAQIQGTTSQPFVSDRLHLLDSSVVYAGNASGGELKSVVVIQTDKSPGMLFAQRGNVGAKGLVLSGTKDAFAVSPANPYFGQVFAPPVVLGDLFSDIGSVTDFVMGSYLTSKVDFLVAAGGLLLMCLGGLFFLRLTSWPLLNAFLVLLLFRGIFWLHQLAGLQSDLVKQMADSAHVSGMERLVPSALLGILGLIFVAIDMVRPAKDAGERDRG